MVMNLFEVEPFQTGTDSQVTCSPIESVDLNTLLSFEDAQLDGEADLVVELIDLYLEEVDRQLGIVSQAVSDKDSTTVKRAAHSLKGSSSNLGILQMALICEQLEKPEGSDPFPYLEELSVSLQREFKLVREILLDQRKLRTNES